MKTFLKGWVLNPTLNHVQIIPNMMYIIIVYKPIAINSLIII